MHARVAIQPHDERVPQCARLLQAADMAGMQQVKAAVGENNAAAVAFLAAKPQNRFLQREDRTVQRVSMRIWTKLKMSPLKNQVYHAREARRLHGAPSR